MSTYLSPHEFPFESLFHHNRLPESRPFRLHRGTYPFMLTKGQDLPTPHLFSGGVNETDLLTETLFLMWMTGEWYIFGLWTSTGNVCNWGEEELLVYSIHNSNTGNKNLSRVLPSDRVLCTGYSPNPRVRDWGRDERTGVVTWRRNRVFLYITRRRLTNQIRWIKGRKESPPPNTKTHLLSRILFWSLSVRP